MAELRPYPFGALLGRIFRELEQSESIFDLPRRKFFLGGPRDYSVEFHGKRASSALGPAAGPQTQMAQNLVLSWLAGCRVMELKTVQILDTLELPRPCIDMETVGFNVEWSQELTLEQSLQEYVKGSMLIEILQASGVIELEPGYRELIFDMSVGYDLAGIKTERVQAFINGMLDAQAIVDRLRGEIPDSLRQYRDLDFRTRLSDSLTLSTFHGCPPDEIERMISFLLEHNRLDCVVKLNPTLLGREDCARLLHEELGYRELEVPARAFEQDTRWEQALGIVDRLGEKARALGRGFGVKFSNTLIVRNHREFFPQSEEEMYLSGQPLHVLAINLVARFREHFGDRFPISFSAGIDRHNFADAVAIGLVPITVCSDLLRPGGYGRASGYMAELDTRMAAVGAETVADYILRAYSSSAGADGGRELATQGLERLGLANDDPVVLRCQQALASGGDLRQAAGAHYQSWLSEVVLLNTEHYLAVTNNEPRYRKAKNSKPPRKLGSSLSLFDCVTCNKCVPVCPNHANFVFVVPPIEVPIIKLRRQGETWIARQDGTLSIAKKQQYGNFADFCNDCGNCDVFCPEDGGPYAIKARFFGNRADFDRYADANGFYFESSTSAPGGDVVFARIGGHAFRLECSGQEEKYSGDGFDVALEVRDRAGTIAGHAEVEVDLTYVYIMAWIRDAVYAGDQLNYLSLLR